MISVRPYRTEDRTATAGVFYRAVHEGTGDKYTAEQRQGWARNPAPDLTTPDPRAGQDVWVSEEDGRITGFMALDKSGYLDMAFVLPEVMGKGHAKALYDVLLAHAQATGLTRMTVSASHFSRRFLEKQGWQLDGVEDFISPSGIHYDHFMMSLVLA
jgi:putative acetyltransferase